MTHVEVFPADHARITPELPHHLVGAHVECINFHRTPLEQAVRETAGGGAHVHRDQAGDVDAEMLQRALQFETAPAHEARRCFHFEQGIIPHQPAGLGHHLITQHHLAGHDEPLCLLTGRAKAALDERQIQSNTRHQRPTG